MKSGFVAILGRPNAGKSTFLNAFISKKVSVVSPKSQTTRENIIGIYHQKDAEISFIDTPGIFEGKEALYKKMSRDVTSSLRDADVALYIVDLSRNEYEEEVEVLKSFKVNIPLIILLNKIDLVNVVDGMRAKELFNEAFPTAKLIEISALKNFGLADVKKAILEYLPEGLPFYEEERYTDKNKEFLAKEVIRAKLLHFLDKEIPHQCAVKIDSFNVKGDSIAIEARIYCEKKRHLSIVVGKKGEMIKKISMAARQDLERDFHAHVSLYLNAIYAENWRNSPRYLQELGYGKDA